MNERKSDLALLMTLEMGKSVAESETEVAYASEFFRWFAEQAVRIDGRWQVAPTGQGRLLVMKQPVGPAYLITPWNFPAAIPAWKLAPALAYGNTVVLKLATDAPVTGLRLAECLAEAGLPAGVLNVITGSGSTVGNAIVRDPRVRAISFTGSVPVGQSVREEATSLGKRVQLELGGHNPLIVLADAKLDAAVEAAYAGAFWSAGQKCTATRRIFVQDSVYDSFRQKLLDRVASGKVGDPADPETEVGPIVNEKQFDEIMEAIDRGRSEGGELITGGGRADDTGFVIEPTVFEGVGDDAYLSCEEVFGPVTSLYRIGDLDEGLRRANAVEFGLSAALFTQSLEAAQRFANEAEAGILHVNSQTAGAEVHVPFGGIKASGFGPHEQGRAALEFYTEVVTVYQDV
jgi:aldehyde dehydrogenase (NAD+)